MSQAAHFAHSTLLCALLAGVAAAHAVIAADSCEALYNAGIKSIQTPHHVYSTTTRRGGKPESGEAIFDGNTEYLRLHGVWQRSRMPQQDMLEAAQEKLRTHPDTCSSIGGQTADGRSLSVYKAHNNESGTDQLVRILEPGLMQGSTLTLPDGSVMETRYEYDHVQAPVGVQ